MKHRSTNCRCDARRLLTGIHIVFSAALCGALALPSASARGQAAAAKPLDSLSEGVRVRIKPSIGKAGLIRGERVIAVLRRQTADSVTVFSPELAPVALSLSQITTLEASEGTRRLGKEGLAAGLLSGGVVGALFGNARGDDFIMTKEENSIIYAVMFGAIGALAGGVIGSAKEVDVWRPVDVRGSSRRVSVRPQLGITEQGLRVSVKW